VGKLLFGGGWWWGRREGLFWLGFAFVGGNCITTLLDIKIVLWGSGSVCWVERKKERKKSEHHLPVKQGKLFIFGCK
jgi:hypothetical protein